MNKTESYIKKEIIRIVTAPSGECWAREILEKLTNDVFAQMEKGHDVDNAIFKVLDTYY